MSEDNSNKEEEKEEPVETPENSVVETKEEDSAGLKSSAEKTQTPEKKEETANSDLGCKHRAG